MSTGGGSRTETVQQTTQPWAGQQPYLERGFSRAEDIYDTPLEYFEGSVVPYSPYSQEAISGIADRARAGSPLVGSAQDEMLKTIQGDYLNAGNPYMSQVADDIAGEVMPRVQGAWGTAGRSGGSALAQSTAAKEMTRALAPYQFGAYADERARQMQAAGMAPQMAATDYADLQALLGAGGLTEQKQREMTEDEARQFYFEQDEPRQRLENYMRMISGSYGGTTIGDQLVPRGNPLMQGLGLAIGGAGALGGLGWKPFP